MPFLVLFVLWTILKLLCSREKGGDNGADALTRRLPLFILEDSYENL